MTVEARGPCRRISQADARDFRSCPRTSYCRCSVHPGWVSAERSDIFPHQSIDRAVPSRPLPDVTQRWFLHFSETVNPREPTF